MKAVSKHIGISMGNGAVSSIGRVCLICESLQSMTTMHIHADINMPVTVMKKIVIKNR